MALFVSVFVPGFDEELDVAAVSLFETGGAEEEAGAKKI